MQKTIKILLIPLIIGLFLPAILFTSAQITDTSAISLSGTDWTLKVDSQLQTATDSKSVPYVSTTAKGEKELFLQLNSLEDCKLGYIQFKVATTGLTVYKQLPLNEEIQLEDGNYDYINATHAMLKGVTKVYRPENVVNSFACFDASGKKVLHIYASKLIDAGNNAVWVDSDLKDGLLTVYLDAKFLDSAKFPVILDPTFGYSSIGGTTNDDGDTWVANQYVLSEDTATGLNFFFYHADNTSGTCTLYIFNDNAGEPVGTSTYNTGSISLSSAGWYNKTIAESLSSGTYWLGFYASAGKWASDSGSNLLRYAVGTEPLTWNSYGTKQASIYIEYTTEPEPTPTATPTPTPEPTGTPEPTTTPTEFASTEEWNIIILLFFLTLGIYLTIRPNFPIIHFIFGMFAIAISAWTLTVAPYFGGLLQLAVIIIGIIVMVSGYKEVY